MPGDASRGPADSTPLDGPLALAIDVGTSAVRAYLYDVAGNGITGTRLRYTWTTTPDGGAEIAAEELLSLIVEAAVVAILLRQRQGREKNRVIHFLQRLFLQIIMHKISGFFLIQRQPALINALVRREHWLITEHDLEELKLRHVSPDNTAPHRRRG